MPTSDAESKAAMDLQAPVTPVPTPLATTDVAPLSFEGFVQAVSTGKMSAEAVEKLAGVFLKVQDHNAIQQYNVAFAAFRKECPPPPREHVRSWKKAGDSGAGFKTYYADTETILRTVSPVLAAHDLCISFDDGELDGNVLTECCRCSHVGGYSRTAKSQMPLESASPAMSAQDRFDAASTRARRQALQKVLGIWTEGYTPGTDAEPEPPTPSPLLTEKQRQHIEALVEETGADWSKVLGWWKVANLNEACQDKYEAAVRSLEWQKQQRTEGT
jgi:hypothetical protein